MEELNTLISDLEKAQVQVRSYTKRSGARVKAYGQQRKEGMPGEEGKVGEEKEPYGRVSGKLDDLKAKFEQMKESGATPEKIKEVKDKIEEFEGRFGKMKREKGWSEQEKGMKKKVEEAEPKFETAKEAGVFEEHDIKKKYKPGASVTHDGRKMTVVVTGAHGITAKDEDGNLHKILWSNLKDFGEVPEGEESKPAVVEGGKITSLPTGKALATFKSQYGKDPKIGDTVPKTKKPAGEYEPPDIKDLKEEPEGPPLSKEEREAKYQKMKEQVKEKKAEPKAEPEEEGKAGEVATTYGEEKKEKPKKKPTEAKPEAKPVEKPAEKKEFGEAVKEVEKPAEKTLPKKGTQLKKPAKEKQKAEEVLPDEAERKLFQDGLESYFQISTDLDEHLKAVEAGKGQLEGVMEQLRPLIAKFDNLVKEEGKFKAEFESGNWDYVYNNFKRETKPYKDLYTKAFNMLNEMQKETLAEAEKVLTKVTAQERFSRGQVAKALGLMLDILEKAGVAPKKSAKIVPNNKPGTASNGGGEKTPKPSLNYRKTVHEHFGNGQDKEDADSKILLNGKNPPTQNQPSQPVQATGQPPAQPGQPPQPDQAPPTPGENGENGENGELAQTFLQHMQKLVALKERGLTLLRDMFKKEGEEAPEGTDGSEPVEAQQTPTPSKEVVKKAILDILKARFVDLVKATVQVKPYQRKGKYVTGYSAERRAAKAAEKKAWEEKKETYRQEAEKIGERIARGEVYLETAFGRYRVTGYNHETGWAMTHPEGKKPDQWNQRSFMVNLSDFKFDEHPSKPEGAELYQKDYGYEKPVKLGEWGWSTTFGRWGRSVEFADGTKVFTWPKVEAETKVEAPAMPYDKSKWGVLKDILREKVKRGELKGVRDVTSERERLQRLDQAEFEKERVSLLAPQGANAPKSPYAQQFDLKEKRVNRAIAKLDKRPAVGTIAGFLDENPADRRKRRFKRAQDYATSIVNHWIAVGDVTKEKGRKLLVKISSAKTFRTLEEVHSDLSDSLQVEEPKGKQPGSVGKTIREAKTAEQAEEPYGKQGGDWVKDAKDSGWWDDPKALAGYLEDMKYDLATAKSPIYPAPYVGELERDVSIVENRLAKLSKETVEEPKADYGQEVASTILQQMGGAGRITAMTGAKNFVRGTDNGKSWVSFQFPNRGQSKPNYVKVTLEPDDTYTVEFGRRKPVRFGAVARAKEENQELGVEDFYKKLSEHNQIYAEDLKGLFEHQTGLYLSLGGSEPETEYGKDVGKVLTGEQDRTAAKYESWKKEALERPMLKPEDIKTERDVHAYRHQKAFRNLDGSLKAKPTDIDSFYHTLKELHGENKADRIMREMEVQSWGKSAELAKSKGPWKRGKRGKKGETRSPWTGNPDKIADLHAVELSHLIRQKEEEHGLQHEHMQGWETKKMQNYAKYLFAKSDDFEKSKGPWKRGTKGKRASVKLQSWVDSEPKYRVKKESEGKVNPEPFEKSKGPWKRGRKSSNEVYGDKRTQNVSVGKTAFWGKVSSKEFRSPSEARNFIQSKGYLKHPEGNLKEHPMYKSPLDPDSERKRPHWYKDPTAEEDEGIQARREYEKKEEHKQSWPRKTKTGMTTAHRRNVRMASKWQHNKDSGVTPRRVSKSTHGFFNWAQKKDDRKLKGEKSAGVSAMTGDSNATGQM